MNGAGDAPPDPTPAPRPEPEVPDPLPAGTGVPPAAILALGIAGVVLGAGSVMCGACAVGVVPAAAAWGMGHSRRKAARALGRRPHELVNAGWILGIVGTALAVLGLAIQVAAFGFALRSQQAGR